MNSLRPPRFPSRVMPMLLVAFAALLAGNRALAASAPHRGSEVASAPFAQPRATPLLRSDDYRLPRIEPGALLTPKGMVDVELRWATNIPDVVFRVLFSVSKAQAAQFLCAEKTRVRQVRELHEMVDLAGLSDPAQAKAFRKELHRALAAAR